MFPFQPKSLTGALVLGSFAGYAILAWNSALSSYGASGALLGKDFADAAVSAVIWQFLHANFFHFLGNAFFLLYFGSNVERQMGDGRYAWLFFVESAVSTAALAAFALGPTVGMSGFTMAVLAYSAVRMRETRHPDAKGAFLFLFLNVAIGLFGNVSLVAHLAGAVSGIAFRVAERILTKRRS